MVLPAAAWFVAAHPNATATRDNADDDDGALPLHIACGQRGTTFEMIEFLVKQDSGTAVTRDP
jgi:ankyrin repeat protein